RWMPRCRAAPARITAASPTTCAAAAAKPIRAALAFSEPRTERSGVSGTPDRLLRCAPCAARKTPRTAAGFTSIDANSFTEAVAQRGGADGADAVVQRLQLREMGQVGRGRQRRGARIADLVRDENQGAEMGQVRRIRERPRARIADAVVAEVQR